MHLAPPDTNPAVKTWLAKAGCAALRLYFQYFPYPMGKRALWEGVALPYLAWRPIRIEARAAFGARFLGSFPDLIHTYLYFFGVWEPAITAYFRRTLHKGDIVVDIGANIGAHALLASGLVGPRGRVHAIEASPRIFQLLQRNIAANRASNVLAYNLAVMDKPGLVPVFLNDATNLGRTTVVLSEAAERHAVQEAVVEGRPLQAIVPLDDILAARLIKVDVEGAEWLVVSGVRDLLPALRADAEILIEVTPRALETSGASLDALIDVFATAGFEPFEVARVRGP